MIFLGSFMNCAKVLFLKKCTFSIWEEIMLKYKSTQLYKLYKAKDIEKLKKVARKEKLKTIAKKLKEDKSKK